MPLEAGEIMAETIQVARRSLFPKCPYCQDLIKPNEAVVVCSQEHAYLHSECREIDPICPILGCGRELQYFGVKRPTVNPPSPLETFPKARDMTVRYCFLFAIVAMLSLSLFCYNTLRDQKAQLEITIQHMERSRIWEDRSREQRAKRHKKELVQERAEKEALRQHNKDLNATIVTREIEIKTLKRTQRKLEALLIPSHNCIVTGKHP